MRLALQRIRQDPPGSDKTFITYRISVGYALADEARNLLLLREGKASRSTIPVDISLNEVVCSDRLVSLGDGLNLRVSDPTDILAEKLRAILQQVIRNRDRGQDLLDIAVAMRVGREVDRGQLADFLLRKAAARDVTVSRSAFHGPDVAIHARRNYDALAATTRVTFVPFEQALQTLYRLVDSLPIPE